MPRNVNGELFFPVISKELNPEMRETSLGNGQGGHFGWPFFKFQKNLILSKRGQVLSRLKAKETFQVYPFNLLLLRFTFPNFI